MKKIEWNADTKPSDFLKELSKELIKDKSCPTNTLEGLAFISGKIIVLEYIYARREK